MQPCFQKCTSDLHLQQRGVNGQRLSLLPVCAGERGYSPYPQMPVLLMAIVTCPSFSPSPFCTLSSVGPVSLIHRSWLGFVNTPMLAFDAFGADAADAALLMAEGLMGEVEYGTLFDRESRLYTPTSVLESDAPSSRYLTGVLLSRIWESGSEDVLASLSRLAVSPLQAQRCSTVFIGASEHF